MKQRHEILIRAVPGDEYGACSLEIRCSCGVFLVDRPHPPGAEISLVELTGIVTAHYAQAARPELSNGSTKLIKGRKLWTNAVANATMSGSLPRARMAAAANHRRRRGDVDETRWRKAKLLVRARDGDKCLKCLGVSDVVHHRVVRGMGGSGDDEINYGLANLVSLCDQCHREVHENPAESYENGFLVPWWCHPEKTPLIIRPGSFSAILTKDGDLEITKPLMLF